VVVSLGVADSEPEAVTVALGVSEAVRELVAVAEVELVPLSVCTYGNGTARRRRGSQMTTTATREGRGSAQHVVGSVMSRQQRGAGTSTAAPKWGHESAAEAACVPSNVRERRPKWRPQGAQRRNAPR
jgi:hypothetical protein